MKPEELRAARHKLNLSAESLAQIVGVESGRTVRRWEAGDREIPGSVAILVKLMLDHPQVRTWLKVEDHAKGAD
jgi:DNA-binding transcriptional regulator YiaG